MLTIKKASERISIAPSTIRYYDDQGLLPFIKRDRNGYRLFSEEDLYWLEFINCMRAIEIPVETLRSIAHLYETGEETLNEPKKILELHQKKLIDEKKDIDVALGKLKIKMKILKSLYDD